MSLYRAIALDPGGTTGWAMFTCSPIETPSGDVEVYPADRPFQCGQLGPDPHHKKLEALLEFNRTRDYHVITESFEYRNGLPKAELVSVEYIGVARLWCENNGIPLSLQTASQGKVRNKQGAFVKPSNLKRLGLWSPSFKHAMDGYGHLLWWMLNNKDCPIWLNLWAKKNLLEKGWK